ncbi:threonine synthase [Umboniibacter marinipuniceus]|uniref:Threonine synthase n=1 Tax=Umboniibacter marinipuniceus TaxID=569599 RepID=A0A3M0A733_9GAMM|nr:threonine synthase [Umboniibacter marinipuniceus]RMA79349.1 L-threonine synthase [Umboniibacter marinipuniceus]
MKYQSTRGASEQLSFEDVLLKGLANDGGLFVPTELPKFSNEDLTRLATLSYEALAFEIMWPFVEGCISAVDFRALIDDAYAQFNHSAVAPLVQIDQRTWVLELFHGPTLAFKDFALQLLGRLLNHFLSKRNQHGVVMGATSGDTGSAAIEACVACDHLDIFILHPHQRVSEVQRRQMTTVLSDNVHNIALEGHFDNCQQMVKTSFADQSFLPEGRQLIAVNSINWARIMAQIVYYFSSALALGAPQKQISFSVPTGNFGDIYAGYLAKQMGLPIGQLVVATNANNILHRAISANDYSKQGLQKTYSPSMDIMVSSNFERLLFDAFDQNGEALKAEMESFAATGELSLPAEVYQNVITHFSSAALDDEDTLTWIRDTFAQSGYLADPHTAIGIGAAAACRRSDDEVMVCLATAHAAKFEDAVKASGVDQEVVLPAHLTDLLDREESYEVIENNLETVQSWIQQQVNI